MSPDDELCLYGRGRSEHVPVDPVRVATTWDADGTPHEVLACAEHAPPVTVARGGELR